MARVIVLLWFLGIAFPAASQRLALTFDDGLDPDREPRAAQWYGQMLAALEQGRIKAMLFPAIRNIGGENGVRQVARWSDAGHAIGNHTAHHPNLNSSKVTLEQFIVDVQEGEVVLGKLPTWRRLLRFPYLKEGDTAEKRDGIRAWMRAHGYRPAEVSIDASDWYYNQAYLGLLESADVAALEKLKAAYLAHLLDRARYYDALARKATGRSPAHVLLLHTNGINAAWLPEVVDAFRKDGWSFVPALDAFDDPLYREEPDVLPAGESIAWALAKSAGEPGLRYPAEDSRYEAPKLRALGLPAP